MSSRVFMRATVLSICVLLATPEAYAQSDAIPTSSNYDDLVALFHEFRGFQESTNTGRQALLAGDRDALGQLVDANFDLRARVYKVSPGNREMIDAARKAGATAKFAGSGGAIVGTYRSQRQLQALHRAFDKIGVAIIKPEIAG